MEVVTIEKKPQKLVPTSEQMQKIAAILKPEIIELIKKRRKNEGK